MAPDGINTSVSADVGIYSGPISNPDLLARYDEIDPGRAAKWLQLQEDESRRKMMLDNCVIMSAIARSWGGLIGSMIVSMFVVSVGGLLVYNDHDTAGAAIITTTVVALAKTFIYGTASRRQERSEISPTK